MASSPEEGELDDSTPPPPAHSSLPSPARNRSLSKSTKVPFPFKKKVAAQEQDVAALEGERERWRDPAYVEQQARQRLKFVKPGERSYTVLDPEPTSGTTDLVPDVATGEALPLLESGLLSPGGDDGFTNSPRRARAGCGGSRSVATASPSPRRASCSAPVRSGARSRSCRSRACRA